jgi:ketosteroid isomerase-like protein
MRVADVDVVAGTGDDAHAAAYATAHARAVLRLMTAFTEQDRGTIEALLHPSCVWRVPGDNALAGEYVGRPHVLELFGVLKRLFTGPARFEVIDLVEGENRTMLYQYADVEMGGRTLRMRECLVFRFDGERIVEVDEFQHDQLAFDQAFSRAAVAALLRG